MGSGVSKAARRAREAGAAATFERHDTDNNKMLDCKELMDAAAATDPDTIDNDVVSTSPHDFGRWVERPKPDGKKQLTWSVALANGTTQYTEGDEVYAFR